MIDTKYHNEEIDLAKLVRSIVAEWKTILFFFTVSVIASVIYAIKSPDIYTSTAMVIAAPTPTATQNLEIPGKLGSVASLIGLNGDKSNDNLMLALAMLKSWEFVEFFISKRGIGPQIYASTSWDKDTDTLVYDASSYDAKEKKWIHSSRSISPTNPAPSSWYIYKIFEDSLGISTDTKSGIIRISISHYSPKLAQKWVDWIIQDINQHLKKEEIEDTKRRIDFLKNEIEKNKITQIDRMFNSLIEEQTKILMLAEATDEFVLKTVSKSKVPVEKSGPDRILIITIGIICGLALSFVFIYMKNFIFRSENSDNGL
ncbi:hypothetical protein FT643_12325 [Ketobacter sp. MCCC 1A13808]|uniref:Wzz/FepE/Etk N-terminal domain-containing protein n=1 Tax=Ketobacter sp. MCCC 1A13808 TaxID=2602738 RepID=UPI0012ECB091|nr:Wzz/FepE/Etk N-terminal domain-containing protein [Ketobacter sp. MCCC 1A13808]MVF12928.1 hypothetical protein [Ketobacter sp. MCCC 1A13808]